VSQDPGTGRRRRAVRRAGARDPARRTWEQLGLRRARTDDMREHTAILASPSVPEAIPAPRPRTFHRVRRRSSEFATGETSTRLVSNGGGLGAHRVAARGVMRPLCDRSSVIEQPRPRGVRPDGPAFPVRRASWARRRFPRFARTSGAYGCSATALPRRRSASSLAMVEQAPGGSKGEVAAIRGDACSGLIPADSGDAGEHFCNPSRCEQSEAAATRSRLGRRGTAPA